MYILVGFGMYGFIKGEPKKLFAPLDASNNFCGVGDYKDFPRMTINLKKATVNEIFGNSECVKECPAEKDAPYVCKDGKDCGLAEHEMTNVANFCLPKKLSTSLAGGDDNAAIEMLRDVLHADVVE